MVILDFNYFNYILDTKLYLNVSDITVSSLSFQEVHIRGVTKKCRLGGLKK